MGFALTPTAGSHGRHERVFLDRMYLELDAFEGQTQASFGGWFLRPGNLQTAADELRRSRFTVQEPESYAGLDGTWQGLAIGRDDAAFPLLTIRTDARIGAWPPPLQAAHGNDVRIVSYLEVASGSPGRVREALTTLGAARSAHELRLADGTMVNVRAAKPTERPGLVAVGFRRQDGKQALLQSGGRGLEWT